MHTQQNNCPPLGAVERAVRYLNTLPAAVSGCRGRDATWKAAIAAVRGFNLVESEALEVMAPWNSACDPPWTEDELLRFIREAAAKSTRPHGYLLGEDSWRPSFSAPRLSTPVMNDDAAKAARRAEWGMRRLNEGEMRIVSSLRPGVSFEAVHLLASHRFLWRARHRNADCFVIRDGPEGTFAQARRFDGERFATPHGPAKNVNLPGSQGRWLSPGGLGRARHVLVAEGAIAALELIEIVRRAEDVSGKALSAAALVSVSASVNLTAGILEDLAGRRITILADADDAGADAAARWSGQITTTTGARPRCLRPTNGCKDFGEMLAALPADAPVWNELALNF